MLFIRNMWFKAHACTEQCVFLCVCLWLKEKEMLIWEIARQGLGEVGGKKGKEGNDVSEP